MDKTRSRISYCDTELARIILFRSKIARSRYLEVCDWLTQSAKPWYALTGSKFDRTIHIGLREYWSNDQPKRSYIENSTNRSAAFGKAERPPCCRRLKFIPKLMKGHPLIAFDVIIYQTYKWCFYYKLSLKNPVREWTRWKKNRGAQ